MSLWTDHEWVNPDGDSDTCVGCGIRRTDVEDNLIIAPNPWLCPQDAAVKARRFYEAKIAQTLAQAVVELEHLDERRGDLVILRDHLQSQLDQLKDLGA